MEEMHGKRYGGILGDDNRKRVIELFAAAVEREEEEYFAVDNHASHVTAAWAGSDPDTGSRGRAGVQVGAVGWRGTGGGGPAGRCRRCAPRVVCMGERLG